MLNKETEGENELNHVVVYRFVRHIGTYIY